MQEGTDYGNAQTFNQRELIMPTHRLSTAWAVALLAVPVLAGCATHGLRSPIREVDGVAYFTAEGIGQKTAMPDFSKRLAWQTALTQLARSRSTTVYERMTRELRAEVDRLAKRRGIEGPIQLIDETTARVPLRNVHELRVRDEGDYITVVLGIALPTWEELIDEAAREVERELRAGMVDLEASPRRRP